MRSQQTTAPVAVAVTAGAAAMLCGLIVVSLQSATGQQWDDSAMRTVVAGRDTQLKVLSVLGYISIGTIVVVLVGCAAVALLRGKLRLAFAAAIIIAGANVTTQLLKEQILVRPDFDLGVLNSLPSGHTTVAASTVGAALLVAPTLARPLIATIGALVTTLTGASTVVAGWHRPSDVVAALAVSLIWTGLAALFVAGPRQPVLASATGAILGSGSALAFLVMIGVRPVTGWDGFANAALVLGAISAATAAFVTAIAAIVPTE